MRSTERHVSLLCFTSCARPSVSWRGEIRGAERRSQVTGQIEYLIGKGKAAGNGKSLIKVCFLNSICPVMYFLLCK